MPSRSCERFLLLAGSQLSRRVSELSRTVAGVDCDRKPVPKYRPKPVQCPVRKQEFRLLQAEVFPFDPVLRTVFFGFRGQCNRLDG